MEHDKRKWLILLSVTLGLFLVGVPVVAHHGTAISYFMDQNVEIRGVVTEWNFRSPHIQLYMDVTDEGGKVVPWAVEAGGVYYWTRAGWDRNSVQTGDEVVVTMSPSKAGSPVGVVSKLFIVANDRLPEGRLACGLNPRPGPQDC